MERTTRALGRTDSVRIRPEFYHDAPLVPVRALWTTCDSILIVGGVPMAQVLIRGLEDVVVERLKKRASANGRSLEAELRAVIEQAASLDVQLAETRDVAARLRRRLAGRTFSSSADLIAEDRRR